LQGSAVETVVKIIADTGKNAGYQNPKNHPYSSEIIYQILVQILHLQKNRRSVFDAESKVPARYNVRQTEIEIGTCCFVLPWPSFSIFPYLNLESFF
jgi:hypothetical protein